MISNILNVFILNEPKYPNHIRQTKIKQAIWNVEHFYNVIYRGDSFPVRITWKIANADLTSTL